MTSSERAVLYIFVVALHATLAATAVWMHRTESMLADHARGFRRRLLILGLIHAAVTAVQVLQLERALDDGQCHGFRVMNVSGICALLFATVVTLMRSTCFWTRVAPCIAAAFCAAFWTLAGNGCDDVVSLILYGVSTSIGLTVWLLLTLCCFACLV